MDITSIRKKAIDTVASTSDLKDLEIVYKSFLGKNGELNNLLKTLGSLPADQRKEAGQSLNLLKKEIEAIYSQKNFIKHNFSINQINFLGDRQTNIKIQQGLLVLKSPTATKTYNLEIKSESEKIITGKDAKGDAVSFELEIKVFLIIKEQSFQVDKKYIENFKYNNLEDKIELRNYEREIKLNLAENITNKIIFDIAKLDDN